MIYRQILPAVLFLLFALPSYANVGIADWGNTTPGGNLVHNYQGDIGLELNDGRYMPGLDKWYFYKGNMVGVFYDSILLVIDEQKLSVDTLYTGTDRSPEEVIALSGRADIRPRLFTRWYETEWDGSFIMLYPLLLIFVFYVTIPVTILFGWLWYKAIKQRMNMRRHIPVIVVLVTVYLLVDFLLGKFPGSV